MKKPRRKIDTALKAKIALEALREHCRPGFLTRRVAGLRAVVECAAARCLSAGEQAVGATQVDGHAHHQQLSAVAVEAAVGMNRWRAQETAAKGLRLWVGCESLARDVVRRTEWRTAELDRQLKAKSLLVKTGTLIDASLIEADAKRPPMEQGEVAEGDPRAGGWANPGSSLR